MYIFWVVFLLPFFFNPSGKYSYGVIYISYRSETPWEEKIKW